MRHRLPVAVCGFVLGLTAGPTVLAQNGTAEAAWQQFQRAAGGSWLVRWHPATGTPRAIFGHGIELADWRENSLAQARRHAGLALQQHASLLGLGTSEFREVTGARMGRTWTFSFAQHFRGLPVIGGGADVRIHMSGKLVHLGSTAWPIPADFDITPRLDEATATGAAWLAVQHEPVATPQPGRARAVRLVIWGDGDAAAAAPFALAWEVPISAVDAAGQGPIGRVYIDAKTGASLHFTNDKHECGLPGCAANAKPAATPAALPVPTVCTLMAWTHTAFSPASTPTNTPLQGVEVYVPGAGTFVTDQNGQFTVDLAAPTLVTATLLGEHCNIVNGPQAPNAQVTLQPGVATTLQLGTAAATEQLLAHTTAYYWTDRVNRWARGILGNSPQLATADNVTPTVNLASTCNAYYIGNTINFYASGGGCNNTAAASVVAHEWGHGLDDQYSGISQTNGLSEGWGDICSMYLLDDPTIGHDFFVGGGGIRSGTNTLQYPSGSGPHAQGQSWMGFAWKLRQNLRAAFGTPTALTISDDIVVGSIAAGASNQPDAVLAVFQADDNDGLLGNGTPHYNELVAACQAHSLPYPPLVPGYLTHAPLASTNVQSLPRRLEVEAVPFSGTFTQVRVHYGAQQRTMIPTGVANRWQALLPGALAPQVTQYHIEAQHSGGSLLRLPASGEYSYTTLAERRLWLEDFENGAVGWTHGANSGTDDWQIGTPIAHPGLAWTDPTAAASGTRCAGNNLGGLGNGAYAAASDCWLRSPPIDCTGISSVRLRFKRWASVAGPADRLEVRAAGMFTWQSSFSPLIDQGWVVYDTLLPAAPNNPAVVIEFRLVSAGVVQYGGWNLDDVELYSLAYPVAPPASLALQPEQVQQGATVTLQVGTSGAKPFFLVLGDAPGPTTVPGFPTIAAGGNLITLFGATDAAGQFTTTFVAPPSPLTGSFYWSQFLTLDGTGAVITSNPFLSLFTQ